VFQCFQIIIRTRNVRVLISSSLPLLSLLSHIVTDKLPLFNLKCHILLYWTTFMHVAFYIVIYIL